MGQFPAVKQRDLLKALQFLGYETVRQRGSHQKMEAEGRPSLTFAFHPGKEIGPRAVQKVLVQDVGLTQEEALAILKG